MLATHNRHTHTHTHTHTHKQKHTHRHTHKQKHTHTQTQIHTPTHTHKHKHRHTHTHTHTHTWENGNRVPVIRMTFQRRKIVFFLCFFHPLLFSSNEKRWKSCVQNVYSVGPNSGGSVG